MVQLTLNFDAPVNGSSILETTKQVECFNVLWQIRATKVDEKDNSQSLLVQAMKKNSFVYQAMKKNSFVYQAMKNDQKEFMLLKTKYDEHLFEAYVTKIDEHLFEAYHATKIDEKELLHALTEWGKLQPGLDGVALQKLIENIRKTLTTPSMSNWRSVLLQLRAILLNLGCESFSVTEPTASHSNTYFQFCAVVDRLHATRRNRALEGARVRIRFVLDCLSDVTEPRLRPLPENEISEFRQEIEQLHDSMCKENNQHTIKMQGKKCDTLKLRVAYAAWVIKLEGVEEQQGLFSAIDAMLKRDDLEKHEQLKLQALRAILSWKIHYLGPPKCVRDAIEELLNSGLISNEENCDDMRALVTYRPQNSSNSEESSSLFFSDDTDVSIGCRVEDAAQSLCFLRSKFPKLQQFKLKTTIEAYKTNESFWQDYEATSDIRCPNQQQQQHIRWHVENLQDYILSECGQRVLETEENLEDEEKELVNLLKKRLMEVKVGESRNKRDKQRHFDRLLKEFSEKRNLQSKIENAIEEGDFVTVKELAFKAKDDTNVSWRQRVALEDLCSSVEESAEKKEVVEAVDSYQHSVAGTTERKQKAAKLFKLVYRLLCNPKLSNSTRDYYYRLYYAIADSDGVARNDTNDDDKVESSTTTIK